MTGLILAGGKSSRFGRDKTQVALPEDMDMLTRTLKLLESLPGIHRLAVSCKKEQITSFSYRLSKSQYPITIIPDNEEVSISTPLLGLIATLRYLPFPMLVLPCDLPLLNRCDLMPLIEKRNQLQKKSTLSLLRTAVVHSDHKINALAAIYEPESLFLLEQSAASKHFSLHAIIPPNQQILVPCRNDYAFLNMNTQLDFQRAIEIKIKAKKFNAPTKDLNFST